MKVAVIGAGKIGSLYGAYLSKVADTLLISRTFSHVKAINERGLKVEEPDGRIQTYHPRAALGVEKETPADLVMVFVKAMQTEEAIQEHLDIIGSNSAVLTLQNGYGNAQVLEKFVPKERLFIGTTSHGAGMKEPGYVLHTGTGDTVIGALSGNEEKARDIADLLTAAGMETTVSSQVNEIVLRKLIVNTGINALTALVDVPNGALLSYGDLTGVLEALVKEAVTVCNANGMDFCEAEELEHVKTVACKTAANTSSMRSDTLQKRRTEVDYINGAIVSLAEKAGIEAPYNALMTRLVHGLEAKYLG